MMLVIYVRGLAMLLEFQKSPCTSIRKFSNFTFYCTKRFSVIIEKLFSNHDQSIRFEAERYCFFEDVE